MKDCMLGGVYASLVLLVSSSAAAVCLVAVSLVYLRWRVSRLRAKSRQPDQLTVAFFHPYCNAGGGGERVLWCAVKAVQERYPAFRVVVYTGDLDASPPDIVKKVNTVFNLSLCQEQLRFVYLQRRAWVEPSRYPYLTLLGQSAGSAWLAIEALLQLQPDVLLETTGFAWAAAVFKHVGGCRVASYVHYPTVTPDMLRRVTQRVAAHNNRSLIARSPLLSSVKALYYRLFALLYGWAGRANDTVMVNSTWTEDHVNALWRVPLRTHRVYPPCDVQHLKRLQHKDIDTVRIVSIGQFRPEKDHPLQMRALYELRQLVSEQLWARIKLVLVGSVRNDEDRARVQDMRDLCRHLALDDNVEFHVNVTYEQLLEQLSRGLIGLHAMWNEHFGIGVVECMAAGLITLAHRSGGPLMDIIETAEGCRTGYLATTAEEYAHALLQILQLSREQMAVIREAARASVDRFTTLEFHKNFLRATEPLFN